MCVAIICTFEFEVKRKETALSQETSLERKLTKSHVLYIAYIYQAVAQGIKIASPLPLSFLGRAFKNPNPFFYFASLFS